MRNIVTFDEYNEIEFKPSTLIKEYIRLVKEDIGKFFLEGECLRHSSCPGCLGSKISSSFVKFGMHYVECAKCGTLWISPRPDEEALRHYYSESEAREFWRDKLSLMTKGKRKEKIVKPRYQWIIDSTLEYHPSATHILDVNTNQDIVIGEISSVDHFKRKTILDPFISVDDSHFSELDIIRNSLYEVDIMDDVDVITLFEVADRTSNVEELFRKVHRMLKKGGLCFMTDILGSGFDLQVLWDKAGNLFPPDRLNAFSVNGLNYLFERHGFKCQEFSTPGVLDVEIVKVALSEKPDLSLPRFLNYLVQNSKEQVRKSFSEFLQSNLLSSYGRIMLQKL